MTGEERGIPTHTISSFDLHADYHQVTDETDAIDWAHMTRVIEATARSRIGSQAAVGNLSLRERRRAPSC
jgi:hypothetical protein